ncbi:MAG: 2-amino-4-hydroxy-6-hydroxymethyldihydropteridine diphosphokinase [Pseudomonadota bacterium]
MIDVFVGLGSNLGDPASQLSRAQAALAALPFTRLMALSAVYRSRAVGPGEQPDYLNAVARLTTELSAEMLLDALQDIESRQGRQRVERWGARTLDLDLLFYGDEQLDTPRLRVPHPRIAERDFVLYPLRDLTGTNWVLPDGRELDTLVDSCPPDHLERTDIDLGLRSPAD